MTLVYKKVVTVNKALIHHHNFENLRLGFGEIAGNYFCLGFGRGLGIDCGVGRGFGCGFGFGFGFGLGFRFGFGFGLVTISTYNPVGSGKCRIIDGEVVGLELLDTPGEPHHYHFVSALDAGLCASVYQLGTISEPSGTIGSGCGRGIHVFTDKDMAINYDFT